MNRERMRQVADAIERDIERFEGEHFDMGDWGQPTALRALFESDGSLGDEEREYFCGTVGCICGWAVCVAGASNDDIGPSALGYSGHNLIARASGWLGLDSWRCEHRTLFLPEVHECGYDHRAFKGRLAIYGQVRPEHYITPEHAVAMLRVCAERGDVKPAYWRESAPA